MSFETYLTQLNNRQVFEYIEKNSWKLEFDDSSNSNAINDVVFNSRNGGILSSFSSLCTFEFIRSRMVFSVVRKERERHTALIQRLKLMQSSYSKNSRISQKIQTLIRMEEGYIRHKGLIAPVCVATSLGVTGALAFTSEDWHTPILAISFMLIGRFAHAYISTENERLWEIGQKARECLNQVPDS